MSEKRTISLGLLEPKLSQQLAGCVSADDAEHFDRDNDAINRCQVRGLVSRGETERARERLLKRIRAAASSHAKAVVA